MVNEHLQTEGLWHWVNIDPEKPCLVAWLIFQARKCYVNLPWIIIIEPLTLPLSHLILLVGLKRFSNPINPIIIPSKSGSIIRYSNQLPGKQPHNYGKSPVLMGKLTISMAIFQFAFCMFTRPGNQGILFMAPLHDLPDTPSNSPNAASQFLPRERNCSWLPCPSNLRHTGKYWNDHYTYNIYIYIYIIYGYIYIYDIYIYMIYIYEIYIYMIYIYDIHIWYTYMIYIYDIHIWYIYTIYIYDIHIWYTYMIYIWYIYTDSRIYKLYNLDNSGYMILSTSIWAFNIFDRLPLTDYEDHPLNLDSVRPVTCN